MAQTDSSDSKSPMGKATRAITFPEYKTYKDQLNQLMDKKMTFEVQLLTLKREREVLKEGGAKHEDVMMKENAGMQRGIKDQLEMTAESLVRLQTFLASCELIQETTQQKEEERGGGSASRKSPLRGSSLEEERKKKKKKHKASSSSDSDSDDSEHQKKKKKKRKKRKAKSSSESSDTESSSSSSSSDSESEAKKTKRKKKKQKEDSDSDSVQEKKSKKKDASLMAVLAKVSAAYTKLKADNTELQKTIKVLQLENATLKDMLMKKSKTDEEKKTERQEEAEREREREEEREKKARKMKEKRQRKSENNDDDDLNSFDLPEFDDRKLFSEVQDNGPGGKNRAKRAPDFSTDRCASRDPKESPGDWNRNRSEERGQYNNASPKKGYSNAAATAGLKYGNGAQVPPTWKHTNINKTTYHAIGETRRVFYDDRKDDGDADDSYDEYGGLTKERKRQFRSVHGNNEDDSDNDNRYQKKAWKGDFEDDKRSCNKATGAGDINVKCHDIRDAGGEFHYKSTKHYIVDDDFVDNDSRGRSEGQAAQDPGLKLCNKSKPRRSWSRSRSRSRSRELQSRKKPKKFSAKGAAVPEEKPGNICIDDWTPKVSNLTQDPSLMSLKKKMKQREDEEEENLRRKQEEEEEREKKRLANLKAAAEQAASAPPPPPPTEPPRNPVAIQWGQTAKSRQTPDKTLTSKRVPPLVGKMPGRGGKKLTPEPERIPIKKLVSPQPMLSAPAPPAPVIELKHVTLPPPAAEKPLATIAAPPATMTKPMPASLKFAPTGSDQNGKLQKILEAAQVHIHKRNNLEPARPQVDKIEIPLPPLPAAQDKDPEALTDTRHSQPHPAAKTELEAIIELHQTDQSDYNMLPKTAAPPPLQHPGPPVRYGLMPPAFAYPLPMFAPRPGPYPTWTAYEQPAYAVPPQLSDQGQECDDDNIASVEEGAAGTDVAGNRKEEDDAELAMLGIDPNDLAGFGQ